jgi:UDP-N-acetyl-D-mannosaminuronic acid transferase (WecB/TagA/CpsF family)
LGYNQFMNKIDIAGLKVDAITKQDFLEQSLKRILLNQKTFVITPYSEFLYNSFQDPKLLEVFNKADFSLADGIGIFWSKKYLSIPLTANNYWIKILQAAWQIKYFFLLG